MDSAKLIDWMQVIGIFAIILSLMLVAFQIRQDHTLTRSGLGAGTTENNANIKLIATNSDFAKTYAKMLNQADELSDDEIVQLDFFLGAVKSVFVRECYLKARGVFADCENMVRAQLPRYFGNSFAQNWWRLNWSPSPYLPGWINDEVNGLDADKNQQYLKQLRDGS